MADTAYEEKRIRDEAAGWFAKLNNTTISTETLRAFRAWRNADDRRAEAYREIEEFWRRAAKVQNDPEIQRAIGEAQARDKTVRGPLPRLGPKGLAGLALAIAVAGGMAIAWPSIYGRTYETPIGEQRFVRLADGSRVRLDTDSAVRVRLSSATRRVELTRGRAVFDVAHDATRPFVVQAGDASVRTLGTRFEVRRAQTGAQVTLLEGKVRVESTARKAEAWTLAPGEQVRTDGPRPSVQKVDTAMETSWTTGRLVFQRRTLAEAAAEVNRYSEVQVVVEDPATAARQVTGAFDTGDTESFVASVSALYDLKVSREGRTLRLRAG